MENNANGLNKLAAEAHKVAEEHGWYDEKNPSFSERIALFHSEISEALEEYRKGHPINKIRFKCKGIRDICEENDDCVGCEYGKPVGIPIELADCIIRILDTCHVDGIDIEKAIALKHEYNKTRPYRHGGKKC